MNYAIDPIIGAWREGGFLLVLFLLLWVRGPLFTKEIASVYTLRMQNQHTLALTSQNTVERLLDQIDYGRVTDAAMVQALEDLKAEIAVQYSTMNRKIDQILNHYGIGGLQ